VLEILLNNLGSFFTVQEDAYSVKSLLMVGGGDFVEIVRLAPDGRVIGGQFDDTV
jgi:hypothetical protein